MRPWAIAVMTELEIELTRHRSRGVDEVVGHDAAGMRSSDGRRSGGSGTSCRASRGWLLGRKRGQGLRVCRLGHCPVQTVPLAVAGRGLRALPTSGEKPGKRLPRAGIGRSGANPSRPGIPPARDRFTPSQQSFGREIAAKPSIGVTL